MAQTWNFRDECSFYLILIAKESDLDKPQLLLCLQRSARDRNLFLGAATSLHGTIMMAPASPDRACQVCLTCYMRKGQRCRESHHRRKQTERKHTFPTPVFLIFSLEGVVCFNLLVGIRVLSAISLISDWYTADSPLPKTHTPIFLLFLPSQHSGEKQTQATWANLTAESPPSKACGQTWGNKMLLLFHRSSNSLNHLLIGFRPQLNKLNPYITNSSVCNSLSFIANI